MTALLLVSLWMLAVAGAWWTAQRIYHRGIAHGVRLGIRHGRIIERRDAKAAKRKIVASASAMAAQAWLDAAHGGRR